MVLRTYRGTVVPAMEWANARSSSNQGMGFHPWALAFTQRGVHRDVNPFFSQRQSVMDSRHDHHVFRLRSLRHLAAVRHWH